MSRVISLNRYRLIILSLPIVTVLISLLTIIIAYSVAANERENPTSNCTLHQNFPPYISDVGDCKPQSSVFTFGMVLSGCVTFCIIIVRFLQVRNFYVARDCANFASIITGIILLVGKFMAISFQLSSQKLVHYMGAFGYFGGTFVYVCLQSRIGWGHDKILSIGRLACAFGMFCTGLLFALFIIPSLEAKYIDLNISQVSEWCFAGLKMAFMLSFWVDFRDIVPVLDAKHVRRRDSYNEVNEGEYLNIEEPKPLYGYNTPV